MRFSFRTLSKLLLNELIETICFVWFIETKKFLKFIDKNTDLDNKIIGVSTSKMKYRV